MLPAPLVSGANQKPYGLLNPLPVPARPWEAIVGVDFVGPLPELKDRDGTYDSITSRGEGRKWVSLLLVQRLQSPPTRRSGSPGPAYHDCRSRSPACSRTQAYSRVSTPSIEASTPAPVIATEGPTIQPDNTAVQPVDYADAFPASPIAPQADIAMTEATDTNGGHNADEDCVDLELEDDHAETKVKETAQGAV